MNNQGQKVALPALATAANTTKQPPNPPKKGKQTNQNDHLKERATTNEIKNEPGEGRGRATEQKQTNKGRGQRNCFLRSLMLQLAFQTLLYVSQTRHVWVHDIIRVMYSRIVQLCVSTQSMITMSDSKSGRRDINDIVTQLHLNSPARLNILNWRDGAMETMDAILRDSHPICNTLYEILTCTFAKNPILSEHTLTQNDQLFLRSSSNVTLTYVHTRDCPHFLFRT